MPRIKSMASGWRAAVLVAVTYIDFLIFAQFGFLKRLAALGIAANHLKIVMAAMAAGGILFSLLAARLCGWQSAAVRLRAGLLLSSLACFLSLLPLRLAGAVCVAALIGAGLGVLTVTLVTHLRQWAGNRNPLLAVGAGTGIGYLACNLPPLFTASPGTQALVAAACCLAALAMPLEHFRFTWRHCDIVPGGVFLRKKPLGIQVPVNSRIENAVAPERDEVAVMPEAPSHPASFPRILIAFTALVWLDSAAFFIIQNTPQFKAATWQGTAHLWTDGAIHLAAALAGAWLLRRYGIFPVLAGAFAALGSACLLLHNPASALAASAFYPAGVSLYSVALVAYPSILSRGGSTAERARRAGWLYAVAGWLGSGLGVGMGQNLGRVPTAFIVAAGVAILAPQSLAFIRRRAREMVATGLVAAAALAAWAVRAGPAAHPPLTPVEKGRAVYISEGCIHCHSQYVRPGSADALMWGPVEPIAEIRQEHPPLIGDRRQGPDLAEVGARRSPLWLKAHLYDPAAVSGASIMPSYAFLFRDRRGEDLVDYLASLRTPDTSDLTAHLQEELKWQPSAAAWAQASAGEGARLYGRYCATCHDAQGRTRLRWRADFLKSPAQFPNGPFFYIARADSRPSLQRTIARMAKFGIPGTDMPGHEYLPDRQIASIGVWLSRNIAPPDSHAIPLKCTTARTTLYSKLNQ